MEKDFSKNMVYGNFCSMENDAFPIDCETLAALQSNTKKLAVIALVSGCPRLILTGCKLLANGYRSEGYVFMVNDENPLTGEILYNPYQSGGNFCRITETDETVTADGTEYPKAYTVRYLADSSSGSLPWSQFSTLKGITNLELYSLIDKVENSLKNSLNDVSNRLDNFSESVSKNITNEINTEASARKSADNAEASARKSADDGLSNRINSEESARKSADDGLSTRINSEELARKSADDGLSKRINTNEESIKTLSKQIEAINGAPKGIIVMWSGYYDYIPSGWVLCDGNNGTPDLTGRFILGARGVLKTGNIVLTGEPIIDEYVNAQGGSKQRTITLTTANMPKHSHSMHCDSYETDIVDIIQPSNTNGYPNGSADSSDGKDLDKIGEDEPNMNHRKQYWRGHNSCKFKINEKGSGTPFTVTTVPPYYALCFIMKL